MNMRRRQDNSTEGSNNSQTKAANCAQQVEDVHECSDIRGDRRNIAILFFLYLLQGIPLGLTAAIPMLLQNRGASYKQQAEFSFAIWPFSLKLLWAPIVDSVYHSRIGRRKSWLIPTQYLIGLFMLLLSSNVDSLIGGDGIEPDVKTLTTIFFALNFLAATQDIAVDGWALTMLKRCNVGHASTCNTVGQTAGYFLGYVMFIALESQEFCNSYIRQEPKDYGLVTLPEFLWFWGICFLVTTTMIAIFKPENHSNHTQKQSTDPELNITETYKLLLSIVKMKPIQILIGILLTVKVSFAASDAVTGLKLIDAGVPKDKLALLAVPLIPLQIVLPLILSKYTTGPKPMEVYIKAIPYRILFATTAVCIVILTPSLISKGNVPSYYYIILLINYALYQICLYSMFVAVMGFFAKISDPVVGGTYMTLLNTVSNLGSNWPNTVILWLVDVLTWKNCNLPEGRSQSLEGNECLTATQREECTSTGGNCVTTIDGYYIESIACVLYGIGWWYWGSKYLRHLQSLPVKSWLVVNQDKQKITKSR